MPFISSNNPGAQPTEITPALDATTALSRSLVREIAAGEHADYVAPHLFSSANHGAHNTRGMRQDDGPGVPGWRDYLTELLHAAVYPAQQSLFAKAYAFMRELRTELLGAHHFAAALPPCHFRASLAVAHGWGYSETGKREPVVSATVGQAPATEAGLAVHELFHAAGFRRITNANDYGILQHDMLSRCSQSGWAVHPKTSGRLAAYHRLFDLFEEVAAASAELRFHQKGGAILEVVRNATKRTFDPVHTEADRFELLARNLIDPSTAGGGYCRDVSLVRTIVWCGGMQEQVLGKYDHVRESMMRLAPELYPSCDSPADAAERFADDLMRAQITGEFRPVLQRVRDTFGPAAVRFFARLDTADGAPLGNPEHRSGRLLQLFADAAALPLAERNAARALLIEAGDADWRSKRAADVLPSADTVYRRFSAAEPVLHLRELLALERVSLDALSDAAVQGIRRSMAEGFTKHPAHHVFESGLTLERLTSDSLDRISAGEIADSILAAPLVTHVEWLIATRFAREITRSLESLPESTQMAVIQKLTKEYPGSASSAIQIARELGLLQSATRDPEFRLSMLKRLGNDEFLMFEPLTAFLRAASLSQDEWLLLLRSEGPPNAAGRSVSFRERLRFAKQFQLPRHITELTELLPPEISI